ncbi:hypothetical protein GBAR_LOCUS3422 [Geodia barretti]|uniref:Uncharacterized protein n=1 Tax=Geodia barretti TaxID=519541 RepID=A0AA35R491_GEOBA|nr:hypothetical protein GBAR_LOCUS3422 [Geodia barretti]
MLNYTVYLRTLLSSWAGKHFTTSRYYYQCTYIAANRPGISVMYRVKEVRSFCPGKIY